MTRPGYWAAWVRRLLVAAAVAWVGWKLWEQRDSFTELALGPSGWLALYGVLIAYTGAGALLAMAWSLAVRALSSSPVSHRRLLSIHLRTQIAKYLPGNVFHYAGRQAAGGAEGVAQMPLAVASGLEVVGQAAVGAILMIVGASFLGGIPETANLWILFLIAAFGASMPWWLRFIPFARGGQIGSALVYGVTSLYFAYLALLAGLFLATFWLLSGDTPDVITCVSAFMVAWSVGFLVPGAPGGIGVREAVLVALLAPGSGESAALLAALTFRGISVVGDLHLLGLGLLVRDKGLI